MPIDLSRADGRTKGRGGTGRADGRRERPDGKDGRTGRTGGRPDGRTDGTGGQTGGRRGTKMSSGRFQYWTEIVEGLLKREVLDFIPGIPGIPGNPGSGVICHSTEPLYHTQWG